MSSACAEFKYVIILTQSNDQYNEKHQFRNAIASVGSVSAYLHRLAEKAGLGEVPCPSLIGCCAHVTHIVQVDLVRSAGAGVNDKQVRDARQLLCGGFSRSSVSMHARLNQLRCLR